MPRKKLGRPVTVGKAHWKRAISVYFTEDEMNDIDKRRGSLPASIFIHQLVTESL